MAIEISAEKYDKPLLIITMILLAIGTVMVFSSSSDISLDKFGSSSFYFSRHLMRVLLGLTIMIVAMFIDYRILKKFAAPLLILSAILLVITKLVFIIQDNHNPARWLYLGSFTIQSSDIARFSIIVYLASYIDRRRNGVTNYLNGFVPPIIMTGIIMALIIIQPDYSTAIMLGIIVMTMLFVGKAKLIHIFSTILGSLTLLIPIMLIEPYRIYRIKAFLTGLFDFSGASYQLQQSLISLGNGGIMGVGLGYSSGKNLFLPAPHTDFILSIVGEEIGFLGVFVIITLYLSIFHRSLKIAKECTDVFGILLTIGITTQIILYAFINSAVVTGLVPTTGLPMPFISFGGSGLVMNLLSIGILLNISMSRKTISNRDTSKIISGTY
ncbi:MAG: putative lipid II flippase FtsW [Candidatus Marinimicrobia bacterium]|nr:putative lipid II flippase FtsW [Candidatus Neomarinimicrobiota bacterium]|tara:strand:- start:2412 stop:3560 length:1149 start_codon:yes stop_codon:yes gene_type:complete